LVKKKKEKKDLTAEFLKIAPAFLASTGGSLLLFLLLLPIVLGQLTKSLPQLAALFATLAQAIKDPAAAADDLGELGADTLLALPTGFFGGLAGAGFGLGQDILGGVVEPFTTREGLTRCERFGNDLVLIKRKLDVAKKKKDVLGTIQGTYAHVAKLYDMKRAGCDRPGFISQDNWDRVPT